MCFRESLSPATATNSISFTTTTTITTENHLPDHNHHLNHHQGRRSVGEVVQIRFNGFAPPNEYVNLAHQNRPHYHQQLRQSFGDQRGVVVVVGSGGLPDSEQQLLLNGEEDNEMNTVSTGGGGGGGSIGKKNCEDEVMTCTISLSYLIPRHLPRRIKLGSGKRSFFDKVQSVLFVSSGAH